MKLKCFHKHSNHFCGMKLQVKGLWLCKIHTANQSEITYSWCCWLDLTLLDSSRMTRTCKKLYARWILSTIFLSVLLFFCHSLCDSDLLYRAFRKKRRIFITLQPLKSPVLGCWWSFIKWPANKSDCTLSLRWELRWSLATIWRKKQFLLNTL